jgi:curved DNA-binding protein CbpA
MKKNITELFDIDVNNFDLDKLKKTYLKLIRKYPPEKNPEKFKEIRKAYDIIKNAKSTYDIMSLKIAPPFKDSINQEKVIKYFENKLNIRKDKIKLKRKMLLEALENDTWN